jgi:hypothetical protein
MAGTPCNEDVEPSGAVAVPNRVNGRRSFILVQSNYYEMRDTG